MSVFLLPILNGLSGALKIPALAMFIGQIASTVLGWFAIRMSRGLALNVLVLTMVIGGGAVIALGLYGIMQGLSYLSPDYLGVGFSYFVPSNAIPCVSAIFSARVVRWAWMWQFYAITKVSS